MDTEKEPENIVMMLEEAEKAAFYKWLNRVCKFTKKKLMIDKDVNTSSYSLTMTFPDTLDSTLVFDVTVTAKKVDYGQS